LSILEEIENDCVPKGEECTGDFVFLNGADNENEAVCFKPKETEQGFVSM
jgi:hypothetical protein